MAKKKEGKEKDDWFLVRRNRQWVAAPVVVEHGQPHRTVPRARELQRRVVQVLSHLAEAMPL